MLVIGLQEKPNLFLPLKYKAGGEKDPVAIRYSLGWTVVGPVSGKKNKIFESSNFARVSDNNSLLLGNRQEYETEIQIKCMSPKWKEARKFPTEDKGEHNVVEKVPSEQCTVKDQTGCSDSRSNWRLRLLMT